MDPQAWEWFRKIQIRSRFYRATLAARSPLVRLTPPGTSHGESSRQISLGEARQIWQSPTPPTIQLRFCSPMVAERIGKEELSPCRVSFLRSSLPPISTVMEESILLS